MKFYLKLALGNIKKNKKLYSSYFISTIFSIALYFIIKTVGNSPTLKGQDSITMFLNLGGYVIALFSLIFLFYTNSFVIKNRKKEISLYHILGMEKRNVRSMMLLETIVIALISLVSGIVIGMLLSQITSVIILRILHKSIHFSLIFSIDAFIKTIIIFSIIFFLSLIYNISVVVRSNPIELLKGQNIGEKEPKTKIFLTLLGIIRLLYCFVHYRSYASYGFILCCCYFSHDWYVLFIYSRKYCFIKVLKIKKKLLLSTNTLYFYFRSFISYETKCCWSC